MSLRYAYFLNTKKNGKGLIVELNHPKDTLCIWSIFEVSTQRLGKVIIRMASSRALISQHTQYISTDLQYNETSTLGCKNLT